MSERNTVIRAMHDVGGAVWLGGSLMGAVGLNGGSKAVRDRNDRTLVASSGWARWVPVSAAAIGAHLIGGAGLLAANRARVAGQSGVGANTVAKAALTLAALGTTAYSGVLGARIARAGHVPADGGVTPSDDTPDDVARSQRRLQALQWVTPGLTAAMVVLGSQQGEQQRPHQVMGGMARKVGRLVRR